MHRTPDRSDGQPIVSFSGELVALGPLRRDLLDLYLKWNNDFEVVRTTSQPRPITREALEAEYEQGSKADDQVHFTIYERATMRPIGGANLHMIRRTHLRANFGIMIGEKECWDKGYGTEATRLVLDFAFNAMGLHTVLLSVVDFNERAIRAYVRAGFREIGRWRESYRVGGAVHDIVWMEALATEFASPVLRQLVLGDDRAPTTP
jgi:diamine N-acetyltransferase